MVRVRPFNDQEIGAKNVIELTTGNHQQINLQGNHFEFNHVADTFSTQQNIFDICGQHITDACLEGYNGCVFAYGQTGSGKTFTMQGKGLEKHSNDKDSRGLQPRIFDYLFYKCHQYTSQLNMTYLIKCSQFEIYNEQIYDLLSSNFQPSSSNNASDQQQNQQNNNLQVREDMKKGVYIEGICEQQVSSSEEAIELLRRGVQNRRVGATCMNIESSRSHSVFTLVVESKTQQNEGISQVKVSKLHFVDLAGSERQARTQAEGQRLVEAANINKSLTQLGCVINALVVKAKHIPYRNSKLTFILRDSLGGNSKTYMIANVSPSSCSFSETLGTLKFAQRAKQIQNKAKINEDSIGNVNALKKEIQMLKSTIQDQIAQIQKLNLHSINNANNNQSGKQNPSSQQQELQQILLYNDKALQMEESMKKFVQCMKSTEEGLLSILEEKEGSLGVLFSVLAIYRQNELFYSKHYQQLPQQSQNSCSKCQSILLPSDNYNYNNNQNSQQSYQCSDLLPLSKSKTDLLNCKRPVSSLNLLPIPEELEENLIEIERVYNNANNKDNSNVNQNNNSINNTSIMSIMEIEDSDNNGANLNSNQNENSSPTSFAIKKAHETSIYQNAVLYEQILQNIAVNPQAYSILTDCASNLNQQQQPSAIVCHMKHNQALLVEMLARLDQGINDRRDLQCQVQQIFDTQSQQIRSKSTPDKLICDMQNQHRQQIAAKDSQIQMLNNAILVYKDQHVELQKSLDEQLQQFQNQLLPPQQLQQNDEQFQQLKQSHAALQHKCNFLENSIGQLESNLVNSSSDLSSLQKQFDVLLLDLETNEGQTKELNHQYQEIKTKTEQMQNEKIQQMKQIAELEQSLDEEHMQVESISLQNKQKTEELETLQASNDFILQQLQQEINEKKILQFQADNNFQMQEQTNQLLQKLQQEIDSKQQEFVLRGEANRQIQAGFEKNLTEKDDLIRQIEKRHALQNAEFQTREQSLIQENHQQNIQIGEHQKCISSLNVNLSQIQMEIQDKEKLLQKQQLELQSKEEFLSQQKHQLQEIQNQSRQQMESLTQSNIKIADQQQLIETNLQQLKIKDQIITDLNQQIQQNEVYLNKVNSKLERITELEQSAMTAQSAFQIEKQTNTELLTENESIKTAQKECLRVMNEMQQYIVNQESENKSLQEQFRQYKSEVRAQIESVDALQKDKTQTLTSFNLLMEKYHALEQTLQEKAASFAAQLSKKDSEIKKLQNECAKCRYNTEQSLLQLEACKNELLLEKTNYQTINEKCCFLQTESNLLKTHTESLEKENKALLYNNKDQRIMILNNTKQELNECKQEKANMQQKIVKEGKLVQKLKNKIQALCSNQNIDPVQYLADVENSIRLSFNDLTDPAMFITGFNRVAQIVQEHEPYAPAKAFTQADIDIICIKIKQLLNNKKNNRSGKNSLMSKEENEDSNLNKSYKDFQIYQQQKSIIAQQQHPLQPIQIQSQQQSNQSNKDVAQLTINKARRMDFKSDKQFEKLLGASLAKRK